MSVIQRHSKVAVCEILIVYCGFKFISVWALKSSLCRELREAFRKRETGWIKRQQVAMAAVNMFFFAPLTLSIELILNRHGVFQL